MTFSGVSVLAAGQDQYFFLMKNGRSVGDEGEWWSRADPGNTDMVYDMGARTVVSSCSVRPCHASRPILVRPSLVPSIMLY